MCLTKSNPCFPFHSFVQIAIPSLLLGNASWLLRATQCMALTWLLPLVWPSQINMRIYIPYLGNKFCFSLNMNQNIQSQVTNSAIVITTEKSLEEQANTSRVIESPQWHGSVNNQFLSTDKFWDKKYLLLLSAGFCQNFQYLQFTAY